MNGPTPFSSLRNSATPPLPTGLQLIFAGGITEKSRFEIFVPVCPMAAAVRAAIQAGLARMRAGRSQIRWVGVRAPQRRRVAGDGRWATGSGDQSARSSAADSRLARDTGRYADR